MNQTLQRQRMRSKDPIHTRRRSCGCGQETGREDLFKRNCFRARTSIPWINKANSKSGCARGQYDYIYQLFALEHHFDIKDFTISLLNNCSGRNQKTQQLSTEKRLSGWRSSFDALHSEPEDWMPDMTSSRSSGTDWRAALLEASDLYHWFIRSHQARKQQGVRWWVPSERRTWEA